VNGYARGLRCHRCKGFIERECRATSREGHRLCAYCASGAARCVYCYTPIERRPLGIGFCSDLCQSLYGAAYGLPTVTPRRFVYASA